MKKIKKTGIVIGATALVLSMGAPITSQAGYTDYYNHGSAYSMNIDRKINSLESYSDFLRKNFEFQKELAKAKFNNFMNDGYAKDKLFNSLEAVTLNNIKVRDKYSLQALENEVELKIAIIKNLEDRIVLLAEYNGSGLDYNYYNNVLMMYKDYYNNVLNSINFISQDVKNEFLSIINSLKTTPNSSANELAREDYVNSSFYATMKAENTRVFMKDTLRDAFNNRELRKDVAIEHLKDSIPHIAVYEKDDNVSKAITRAINSFEKKSTLSQFADNLFVQRCKIFSAVCDSLWPDQDYINNSSYHNEDYNKTEESFNKENKVTEEKDRLPEAPNKEESSQDNTIKKPEIANNNENHKPSVDSIMKGITSKIHNYEKVKNSNVVKESVWIAKNVLYYVSDKKELENTTKEQSKYISNAVNYALKHN